MNFDKGLCLCHKYLTFLCAVDVGDKDLGDADNDLNDAADDSGDTIATS